MSKTAKQKQASLPRQSDFTRQFHKDWQRLSHSGRYDMNRLKTIMLQLIANDSPLDPLHKDHELIGNWAGFRECHIAGDFLLIYKLDKTSKGEMLVFTRVGTHAELFG
ncbi:MAG: type II toxin-antitoxin system YafQ family toxin [Thiomicrospira sp.]|nr:type II toxin-antitoxin system YafQ family toxin [Thiomicrospira sp.]